MDTEQLNNDFKKFNLLNDKHSMDRLKFCWKLIESDENKYLDIHLIFLEKANKYFSQDLKGQFKFRKNHEKVFYHLQDKLKENISEKLKTNISQIIEELNFKTKLEYQNWIEEIKLKKRNDTLDFVWSIMKSPFIEYHYNLIKDENLNKNFRRDLINRFIEHKEGGATFLLKKLEHKKDIDTHGEIIFMLGQLAKYNKKLTLQYARELTESTNDYTRDRALIVLGWVGGVKEYSILKDRLLNDEHVQCRAWSASSFMQMWLRKKSEKLRVFVIQSFDEALKKENNIFVLSSIIESIREIENNKFGISQKELDNLNEESIKKSTERIKEYIQKKLHNN